MNVDQEAFFRNTKRCLINLLQKKEGGKISIKKDIHIFPDRRRKFSGSCRPTFTFSLLRFEFFLRFSMEEVRPDDSNKTKMRTRLDSCRLFHFSIRFNFTFERAEKAKRSRMEGPKLIFAVD